MKKIPQMFKKSLVLTFLITSSSVFAQTVEDISLIRKETNVKALESLKKRFENQTKIEKEEALRLAKINNWPTFIKSKDGKSIQELQKIKDGKPIYFSTTNVAAAKSTRANHLHSGGLSGLNLNGENMMAYVWDGGVANVNHQEYDGSGGNNRLSVGDNGSSSNHAAHVTGTIIGSGFVANAKGMAPKAKAKGFDWNSDKSEATAQASNGMLLSNHSYGWRVRDNNNNPTLSPYVFGSYLNEARNWDNIMYNAPYYLMVVSAGNNGNDNTCNGSALNGNAFYDKLTGHATCKNNLVVANANDATVQTDGTLVSAIINSSSSEGPTDDLRIKPDITGNGTGLYSSVYNATSYGSYTGTSMSSPNVTGSLLLLQQHYKNINNVFMKSSTLKGLALHTADDIGASGPDAVTGWGMLNAKSAAAVITNDNVSSFVKELTLNNNDTITYLVSANGNEDLLTSICWTDKPGNTNSALNSSTPALINDLDVRVKKVSNSVISLPYKLTSITTNAKGDNLVDPYEKIDITNPSGLYEITISHKGTLSNAQDFSLIISGINQVDTIAPSTPLNLTASNTTWNSSNIAWDASTDNIAVVGYDVYLDGNLYSSVTTNSIALSNLTELTGYAVTVNAKDAAGNTSAISSVLNFTTLQAPDTIAPSVPLNLSATNTTWHSSDIVWDASTDNIAVVGYDVYLDGNLYGSVTTNSIALSNLTELTGYAVTVNAKDAAGNTSSISSVLNFTTLQAPDTIAPSAPLNLTALNTTWHSSDITWDSSTDNIAVVGYDVYLDGNLYGSVTTNSIALSNLTALTGYAVTVNAKDAAGNTSAISSVLNFTTLQLPDTIAPSTPLNLTATNTTWHSSDITWDASTDNFAVVGYDVYLDGNLYSSVTTNSISLNNLTELTGYAVTVNAKDAAGNTSSISSVLNFTTLQAPDTIAPSAPLNLTASNIDQVSATLNWDASTDNIAVVGYDVLVNGNIYSSTTSTSLNLTNLNANTVYSIGVIAKDAAGNESSNANLNLTTLDWPDTIAPTIPQNITVNNITQTSAGAQWDASTDNVGVDHYVLYLDGNSLGSVNTNSYNFTGLTLNTTYSVEVKAVDLAGNMSSLSSAITFTTDSIAPVTYCSSEGNNQNYEFIKQVKLNQINNSTLSDGGYGDYTNLQADITKGFTESISIKPGFNSSVYQERWRVWIDFNQNGNFENNEKVVQTTTTNGSLKTVSFNVPATALNGLTRMRVSMKYGSHPNSCGNFTYGEVEDYTINIKEDTEAPTTPLNLMVSNISVTNALLTWDASTDNSSFIEYSVFDENNTLIGTTNNTSLPLQNLTANTTYSVYVSASDLAGNISSNTSLMEFTTLAFEYCSSNGTNQNYEFIDYVSLNNIDNNTQSDNGYGDYTHLIGDVIKGENTTITFSAGFNNSTYHERWRVWIDFNQNGNFEANEKVTEGISTNGGNYSKNFTIPGNALSGTTRMRVSMKYGSYPSACGTFYYGETEDYTINVQESNGGSAIISSNNIDAQDLETANSLISAYPNPTQQFLNIEGLNFVNYKVLDLTGRQILEGSFTDKIDVRSINNGTYILLLSDGRTTEQIKFNKI